MKNGKKGGNPTLRKLAEKMRPDNPTVNKGVNPQKPETRNQRDDDDDVREADTLRYRILKEVGADPVSGMTGPNGSLLGTRIDMDRVNAWQTDLGLNSDTIVAVIAETMSRKRDGPPNRFTYFDRAMQKEAGRRNEPRLAPIKETHNERYSKAPEVRRAASADDAFAERISFAARNRSPSRTNCGFS